MAEVIVIPAFTRQLVASVTLFGKKMPTLFVHPMFIRFLTSLGGDIVYGLDASTMRWLDAVAAMYARAFMQNTSMYLGLFEPMDILLVGRGDIDRSAQVATLMKRYLVHRLVPPEAIFSRITSRQLQGNLHQFVEKVRRYPGSERFLKIIFVGNASVANRLNRRVRRIVPLARFGRTGFFQENGIKVFFLSCSVAEPTSVPWPVRVARSLPKVLPNLAKGFFRMIGRRPLSYTEGGPSYIMGVPEFPDVLYILPAREEIPPEKR